MFTKILFASLVLVSSVVRAQADPSPAPTPVELKPIRMAKGHIWITKTVYTATPTGANETTSLIAESDLDVPVLDLRPHQGGNWYFMQGMAKFTSQVSGQPITLQVRSAITLEIPQPSAGGRQERKGYFAALDVTPNGQPGTNTSLSARTSAWSTDLSLRTLGLDMEPALDYVCPKPKPGDSAPTFCKPSLNEYFRASIEITD